jgi:hypothetical protein
MATADSAVKNTDLARVGFGFDFLQDRDIFAFDKSSRLALAPTQLPILWVPVSFWGIQLTLHLRIVPR